MPRTASTSLSAAHEERLPFGEDASQTSRPWFVYLFSLADCSAFKVGFSCNPLHRIYSFSHRYFERFDLSQSRLLQLVTTDDARAVEAALKTELAQFRAACPSWVPPEAGGHTEWFSAVYFGDAELRLQSFAQLHAPLINASDFIRSELARVSSSFERWACGQAQYVCDAWSFAHRGYATADVSRSLQDWLDAYRFFSLPLFADDPPVLEFVSNSARWPIER
jgi:hypothetical protein